MSIATYLLGAAEAFNRINSALSSNKKYRFAKLIAS